VLANERRRFFIFSRKRGTWRRSGARVVCWSVENGAGALTPWPPLNGLPTLPHARHPSPHHLNTLKHSRYMAYDPRSLPGPSTAARGAGPHPPAEERVCERPWGLDTGRDVRYAGGSRQADRPGGWRRRKRLRRLLPLPATFVDDARVVFRPSPCRGRRRTWSAVL